MASNRAVSFQLTDTDNKIIGAAGGVIFVCAAGSQVLLPLFDQNQNAIANPAPLKNGQAYFQVAKTNALLDVFIQAPSGHFRVIKNLVPGDRSSVQIDYSQLDATYVIPFALANQVAATEKDTGLDFPVGAMIMGAGISVEIVTLESGKTINVGLLSTESGGSATALINGLSLTLAGVVKATAAVTATMGAGVINAIATTPAVNVPESKVVTALNPSLCTTLSSTTTVAAGYITIPVQLAKSTNLQQ